MLSIKFAVNDALDVKWLHHHGIMDINVFVNCVAVVVAVNAIDIVVVVSNSSGTHCGWAAIIVDALLGISFSVSESASRWTSALGD